ncbi:MAG: hypothetical protein HY286_18025 [Planctomycetes bacterium]|nr:hypothetical protein [Planctomycetota bacterium]
MAHNPSDATIRLMQVAISGVGTLISIAVAGGGMIAQLDDGIGKPYGRLLMFGGGAAALVCGSWTAWLVRDWRKHRDQNSNRP